jgi:Putative MetA-pathway of phenol degradation
MNRRGAQTKRTGARVVSLALLLAAACGAAAAQTAQAQTGTKDDEPDFIVPARPTVSNPAEFQRPGVLQLEYGFDGNWHGPGGESEQDTPLALRFAVSRRLLLELDTDSPFSQTEGGTRETGAGDTQIGAQVVLRHEDARGPGVALAYYLKLPTASAAKGLGTGRFDHYALALVSRKLGETTLDFNAIYLLAGRTTGPGRASSAQAAFAASRDVTKRLGVQGELSGMTRNDAQAGAVFTLGVVTYQVNRRLVFDGGVRAGLTPEAPRVGVVAGLTVGLARLYGRRAPRE